jgi:hypothetical protein
MTNTLSIVTLILPAPSTRPQIILNKSRAMPYVHTVLHHSVQSVCLSPLPLILSRSLHNSPHCVARYKLLALHGIDGQDCPIPYDPNRSYVHSSALRYPNETLLPSAVTPPPPGAAAAPMLGRAIMLIGLGRLAPSPVAGSVVALLASLPAPARIRPSVPTGGAPPLPIKLARGSLLTTGWC